MYHNDGSKFQMKTFGIMLNSLVKIIFYTLPQSTQYEEVLKLACVFNQCAYTDKLVMSWNSKKQ